MSWYLERRKIWELQHDNYEGEHGSKWFSILASKTGVLESSTTVHYGSIPGLGWASQLRALVVGLGFMPRDQSSDNYLHAFVQGNPFRPGPRETLVA